MKVKRVTNKVRKRDRNKVEHGFYRDEAGNGRGMFLSMSNALIALATR